MKRMDNARTSQSTAPVTLMSLVTLLLIFAFRGVEGFNSQLPPPWVSPFPNSGGLGSRTSSKASKSNNKKVSSSSSNNNGESSSTATSASTTESLTSKNSSPDGTEEEPKGKTNDFPDEASTDEAVSEYLSVARTDTKSSTSPFPAVKVVTSYSNPATVHEYLPALIKMCRPSNLIGVLLLHIVATQLVVARDTSLLISTLLQPSHLLVLSSLVLTSSSSMVVNDYYDSRTSIDALKIRHDVPTPVTKRFLTYLYATLLTILAFLPGKASRVSVVLGSLLTFYYTQHLKPKTWIKNVSCAGLMGLAPLTSAAATCYLEGYPLTNRLNVFRMCAVVFFGGIGREVWMDICDVEGDRKEHVRTVPVVYGKRFASKAALSFSVVMALLAVSTPASALYSSVTNSYIRRVFLSMVGSGMVLKRASDIVRSEGLNVDMVKRGVEESKLALLLVIASFI